MTAGNNFFRLQQNRNPTFLVFLYGSYFHEQKAFEAKDTKYKIQNTKEICKYHAKYYLCILDVYIDMFINCMKDTCLIYTTNFHYLCTLYKNCVSYSFCAFGIHKSHSARVVKVGSLQQCFSRKSLINLHETISTAYFVKFSSLGFAVFYSSRLPFSTNNTHHG